MGCHCCSNKKRLDAMESRLDEQRLIRDKASLSAQSFKIPQKFADEKKEKKANENFLTLFLISLVGFTFLATVIFFATKMLSSENEKLAVESDRYENVEILRDNKDEYLRYDKNSETRISKIERKVSELSNRQWRLALALNENARLSQKVDDRFHPNVHNGYIYFDQYWNMNKLPETMNLTREQRMTIPVNPYRN